MSRGLADRLREALEGSPLAPRVDLVLDPLVLRRGGDAAVARLEGPVLAGLARALVTSVESARFLAHRPVLLERLACAGPDTLERRAAELAAAAAATPPDLEGALDALRLLRRDETLLAAALDFGAVVPFEEVSAFLSVLAEAILEETLARAHVGVAGGDGPPSVAVVGMGKIGGREFTHHSDLDLIFLCGGGLESLPRASRVAQRLISYLTTRTGAGVAYAVDSRLRPSGNQGALVTTFESFVRYQREEAQTWEHLALARARTVAGDIAGGRAALEEVRGARAGFGPEGWKEVADMRRKVETQRADESAGKIAIKTGPGGLMDVDFLAAGAALEKAPGRAAPVLPGNAALLRGAVPGAGTEHLVEAYTLLRRVEARVRWVLGRAAEVIDPAADRFEALLALLSQDESGLRRSVEEARRTVRSGFRAVVEAGTCDALDRRAAPPHPER